MSAGEIMLIFFVALMLFGSKSLPGFAKTLGKAYREFKRASDDITRAVVFSSMRHNLFASRCHQIACKPE